MTAVDPEVVGQASTTSGLPYLVISADSHAGPSLEGQLRPYCPSTHLDAFDDFVRTRAGHDYIHDALELDLVDASPGKRAAYERAATCPGQQDPVARLRDMDESGIAAEVVFAGGQNFEVLPWTGGMGWDAGSPAVNQELRALGTHMWNQWLADFVSVAPERLLGVMQVPIWDVEAAVREVEWGSDHGLKVVNFPASRPDFVPYTDPRYEPFWSACAERGLALTTHSSGGQGPLEGLGPYGNQIGLIDMHWFSRRHLWQVIMGGVFHRHPTLTMVFAEQRVAWVPEVLREMDGIYRSREFGRGLREELPLPPSSYWFSNCFDGASFLAQFELELLDQVGEGNLLWGTDYPHQEGTWPHTRLALRNTFHGATEEVTRAVLGENALRAYHLDASKLRPLADRIGPTPDELRRPLAASEYPEYGGMAFRGVGETCG